MHTVRSPCFGPRVVRPWILAVRFLKEPSPTARFPEADEPLRSSRSCGPTQNPCLGSLPLVIQIIVILHICGEGWSDCDFNQDAGNGHRLLA